MPWNMQTGVLWFSYFTHACKHSRPDYYGNRITPNGTSWELSSKWVQRFRFRTSALNGSWPLFHSPPTWLLQWSLETVILFPVTLSCGLTLIPCSCCFANPKWILSPITCSVCLVVSSQVWRLLCGRLVCLDVKDAFCSSLLIYNFRIFERRFGTRKFAVSITAVGSAEPSIHCK